MTQKKTDLDRMMLDKINGQRRNAAVPSRFAEAATPPDRREQRKLDAAAGLVPFACKLPSSLTQQLRERAVDHAGGLNGLVAELLQKAL